MSFTLIPHIYVKDLPNDVVNELDGWGNELPLHGETFVFNVTKGDLPLLPKFKAWMIKIGAWSEDMCQLEEFLDYLRACPENRDKRWSDFLVWLGPRKHQLKVAMTGT